MQPLVYFTLVQSHAALIFKQTQVYFGPNHRLWIRNERSHGDITHWFVD